MSSGSELPRDMDGDGVKRVVALELKSFAAAIVSAKSSTRSRCLRYRGRASAQKMRATPSGVDAVKPLR